MQDPLANPSQILGSISAVGKVYVLNRNGIAFGTGATINVGSLIAATADIASSQLSHDANGLPIFSLYGAQQANTATYLPTFVNGIATSTVTVAPGASLQAAPASGTTSGGYVYLFGGQRHQCRPDRHAAGPDGARGRHRVHAAPGQPGLDHRRQHHLDHASAARSLR